MTTWLDGPMGTELAARGVALPEREWSAHALDAAPEVVSAIHRAHVAAGVDVLRANTFRTTRRASGERWRERVAIAVRLAREAARGQRVAGVIAPLEDCYRPELMPPPEVSRREHTELATALKAEGVDLIICETFPGIPEALVATLCAAATGLEVWTSLTAGPDATLINPKLFGLAVGALRSSGAKAVLVNCVAPSLIEPYVEALARTGMRFGVYANAAPWAGAACSPDDYRRATRRWLNLGAEIVGTCCGTSLDHLRAVGDAIGRHRVWLSAPLTGEAREQAMELLSPDELAARERFRFERDRDLYLTAHALLRRALSAATGKPERGWRFVEGPHGRPALSSATPGPSFNLSHTHGLAAVVVGATPELGVDAEQVGQRGDLLPVAEHWFNSEEVGGLRLLHDAERQRRFLCFWTVKEAYLKARGVGLQLPLHQLTVHLDEEPTDATGVVPRLVLDPELKDDPTAWQFRLLAPTEQHLVAVAARAQRFELKVELKPDRSRRAEEGD